MKVSIREFNSNVSQFLRRAHAGEVVLVTWRDQPFVEIIAPGNERETKIPGDLKIRLEAIACCRLGQVEMVATFSRAWKRRKRMSRAKAERCRRDFSELWRRTVVVEFSPGIQARAEALAGKHALRGYDAVHLASALHLNGGTGAVVMLSFDQEMLDGCKNEGLPVLGAWEPPI
jgi:antitoxin (DNA-binding transcriptional repressor) of toxin-antitoxin stability system